MKCGIMTPKALRVLGAVALAAAALQLGGCASMSMNAWDRDLLAQKTMKLVPYRIESSVDEHIYYSKEGSTGGLHVGGGGCGCN
jgi:hypothetical protein